MEFIVLALALLVVAAVLAGVGLAGITERLPRNRWLGLRVAALREDDDAWRSGHRAGGSALIAAAGLPLLLAVAVLVAPPEALEDWLLVYAVVGLLTGGLIALASRQAESAVTEPDADD